MIRIMKFNLEDEGLKISFLYPEYLGWKVKTEKKFNHDGIIGREIILNVPKKILNEVSRTSRVYEDKFTESKMVVEISEKNFGLNERDLKNSKKNKQGANVIGELGEINSVFWYENKGIFIRVILELAGSGEGFNFKEFWKKINDSIKIERTEKKT